MGHLDVVDSGVDEGCHGGHGLVLGVRIFCQLDEFLFVLLEFDGQNSGHLVDAFGLNEARGNFHNAFAVHGVPEVLDPADE